MCQLDSVSRASRLCCTRGREEDVYGEQGPFKAMLYKVLVAGEIRDFLGWDVTVISV